MGIITLDQISELIGDYDDYPNGEIKYIAAHCVWHDDRNPSLMVYENGWNRCLGECNKWRRNTELYEKLTGTPVRIEPRKWYKPLPSFPTNLVDLEQMAERAHRALVSNDEFAWYLHQRGVQERIIPNKLGWYNGWITVPVTDKSGQMIWLYARATPSEEEATGKRFTQPRNPTPLPFCPDWSRFYQSPSAIVCYGMMDSLAIASLGLPVITTIGGSNSFDPAWLDDYRKPVYIIPDDKGDTIPAYNLAAALGWRGNIISLPYDDEVHDPADFVKSEVERGEELKETLSAILR